jgi:glutathione synthase/RimK-type ligase-like ATP-grasp enzyme
MLNAVLFKSEERFESFKKKLTEYGVNPIVLDFEFPKWIEFDYSNIDFIIYYPSFKYSSNHPLALHDVYDNLNFLHKKYPQVKMYPDPKLIPYYNDKYRQYLFLSSNGYPIPDTIPLLSSESVELAHEKLGYPMVIKNRYGAGGESVFRVFNKKELQTYFNLSQLNLFNLGSAKYFLNMLKKRVFYYWLVKGKNMIYPFLSPPLLAQKFIRIDRDLKTVVGNYKVVEAHWRIKANEEMWKVNIDGGGIGEWSKIPQEAIDLSVQLAKDLKASWINLDIIASDGEFLITEFSPVWHHYAYKEKPSFVYKDDYNIDVPLDVSLDLERIVVESQINACERVRKLQGNRF